MAADLRHALRVLRRNPAVMLVALASIAIGTGAASIVFTAVKTVLIDPLPYRDPSRLVQFRTESVRGSSRQDWVARSDMRDVLRRGTSLDSLGLYHYTVLNLAGGSQWLPEALYGLTISSSLFPTLGVTPMLGRNVAPEEDQPNHSCVLLLNYGLWVRRFQSDRGVLGKTVQANGRACTIIGVMPPRFNFPMRLATTVRTPAPYTEFWAAPMTEPNTQAITSRQDFGFAAVARLRAGVSMEQAQQDILRISSDLSREFPNSNGDRSVRGVPMVERNLGASRSGLLLMLGAAGLFLLIGCANVANLLLARGVAREREFAIRFAVGANRGILLRQLMTESCVLGVAGGLAGYLLTRAVWAALPAIAPLSIPRLATARADGPVFLFTMAVALLNGSSSESCPRFVPRRKILSKTCALPPDRGGRAPCW